MVVLAAAAAVDGCECAFHQKRGENGVKNQLPLPPELLLEELKTFGSCLTPRVEEDKVNRPPRRRHLELHEVQVF